MGEGSAFTARTITTVTLVRSAFKMCAYPLIESGGLFWRFGNFFAFHVRCSFWDSICIIFCIGTQGKFSEIIYMSMDLVHNANFLYKIFRKRLYYTLAK